jgi:hypothetical protein
VATVVPDTLAEVLEPGWLSQALGRRFLGIAVESVRRGPVVSRVSTNARFGVECRGGLPPGLPAELCVKGYVADCSEAAGASRTAGIPEVLFYRRFAAASGVRTLDCYHLGCTLRPDECRRAEGDLLAHSLDRPPPSHRLGGGGGGRLTSRAVEPRAPLRGAPQTPIINIMSS